MRRVGGVEADEDERDGWKRMRRERQALVAAEATEDYANRDASAAVVGGRAQNLCSVSRSATTNEQLPMTTMHESEKAGNDSRADGAADRELLRRYAREQDDAAFRALVERHLDLVYSVARRRLGGDVHGAADIAQEVFTALARQAKKLPDDVVLPAWLHATTRHLTANRVRAEQSRRAREAAAHRMHETDTEPTAVPEWESVRPVLEAMLDELPERDRGAIVLRFFSRQSYADIGAALRLSEDAARMRVERALEKLRAGLTRRGVVSTASALGGLLTQHAVSAAPPGLAAGVASAAVKAAGVAGIFAFMSSTKVVLGLAASVAVISAVGLASLPREKSAKEESNSASAVTPASQPGRSGGEKSAAGTSGASRSATGVSVTGTSHVEMARGAAEAGKRDPIGLAASLVERRVERLDALVRLTPEQKDKVAALFAKESVVLEGIPVAQRGERGQDARVATRKGVREILTEEQRRKYDVSPQSAGGGLAIDPVHLVGRLDGTVRLTPEQKEKATRIFWDDIVDQVAALPADQTLPGFMWRDKVRGQLREILSPEQQAKFDVTPPYRKNR